MSPLATRKGHNDVIVSRSRQLLAALTCLAGVMTYVTLSNAWRFNVHLHQQQQRQQEQQSLSSWASGAWGNNNHIPSAVTTVAVDHPSHRYLAQGPRPLPGLLDDDDDDEGIDTTKQFNTQIIWPFPDSLTAVRFLFVHVGKAGGMSLYKKISVVEAYRILKCRMNNETRIESDPCVPDFYSSSPVLRQRVFAHLHKGTAVLTEDVETWLHKHTNLALFLARNPISRMVSSFNFQRHLTFIGDPTDTGAPPYSPYVHRNQSVAAHFYNDCFRTIQDVAAALDPRRTSPGVHCSCADLGLYLITGQMETVFLEHFYYNYRRYAERALASAYSLGIKHKHVAVVRTNALWSDMSRLESLMGGPDGRFDKAEQSDYKVTHGSELYEISTGVDEQGAIALCCLLWDDVRVYSNLILRAINLNATEKMDTLKPVFRDCGIHRVNRFSWDDFVKWSWYDWTQRDCRPK